LTSNLTYVGWGRMIKRGENMLLQGESVFGPAGGRCGHLPTTIIEIMLMSGLKKA
jgi:hypothetical protein